MRRCQALVSSCLDMFPELAGLWARSMQGSVQELSGVGPARGHKYAGMVMIQHGVSGVVGSGQDVSGGVRSRH